MKININQLRLEDLDDLPEPSQKMRRRQSARQEKQLTQPRKGKDGKREQ